MSMKSLETKWKKSLISILEELTESQYKKLLFNLDKIPEGVKSSKVREEIPHVVIQYYGAEASISLIDKEMKQLPRMDAAVQDLLRPHVEKLKKQRQKNKADSASVAKKQKTTAGTSKSAAGAGAVPKKPAAGTSKSAAGAGAVPKKPAAGAASGSAAVSGPAGKKQKPAADQQKSCQPDKLDAAAVKPKQTKTKRPGSSMKPAKQPKVQRASVQEGKTTAGENKNDIDTVFKIIGEPAYQTYQSSFPYDMWS